jgi:heptaprenyl diphosphate synthase
MSLEALKQNLRPDLPDTKFDLGKLPEAEMLENELHAILSESTGVVNDMCMHILDAGGKRIRPLLVICSGLIFSGISKELTNAAVAAELIHMASLVHDDIIDKSGLRRHKPSVNKVWGDHNAVLCGDYLFAKAFGLLTENRLIRSMDYMVNAIQNMCEGEITQAANRFNCNMDSSLYYELIAKKTAIFLECCCKSGAVAGGAGELHIQLIGEFGLNLGLAFQITDDIMDYCGNPEVMGKPCYEDLRQGCITLPAIFLLESEKYGGWLRDMILSKMFQSETLTKVNELIRETGAIDRAYSIAENHIEKAVQCLYLLPESNYTRLLLKVVEMLKSRMN